MIKFLCQHDDGTNIQICMSSDLTLDEVIEKFKGFLIACGYHPDSVSEMLDENCNG